MVAAGTLGRRRPLREVGVRGFQRSTSYTVGLGCKRSGCARETWNCCVSLPRSNDKICETATLAILSVMSSRGVGSKPQWSFDTRRSSELKCAIG